MPATKRVLLTLLFCVVVNFYPTRSTHIIEKVTGFVKGEVDFVHDKIKDAVEVVHNIFHPHHHNYKPPVSNIPSHGSGYGSSNRFPPSSGQDHSIPNKGDNSDQNSGDADFIYKIDVRNNEDGLTANLTPSKNENRNIEQERGCPTGQHRDYTGKCRAIGSYRY